MSRLLLLSSDTGEGHNSAARALGEAGRAAGWRVSVRKPLEESTAEYRALSHLYNFLLTHRPGWVGLLARTVDRLKPNEADFCYQQVRNYIRALVESEAPDAILSVHPMLNHMIQRYVREAGLAAACYTFVTDPFPPFWKGWASPYVDRYFVLTDEAGARVAAEVPAHRIERVPMPLGAGFKPRPETEIADLRRRIGIEGDTILVNGGARGGGPLYHLVRAVRSAAPAANVLAVCGRNVRTRERLDRLGDPKLRTYGFVHDIHDLIGASDLMITKPGALSTYESLASAVPAVLSAIGGLMPQESGLFHAARRQGFGFAVRSLEELAQVVRQGAAAWRTKRNAMARFYRSGSTAGIIERIGARSVPPAGRTALFGPDPTEIGRLSHA